jgi:tetratricopeptide (TPR) repeat protein
MTNAEQIQRVKSNLRRPINFIGREDDVQRVLKALSIEERAWNISLVGVGGIGKTELAVQVAHILKDRQEYQNIVWTTAKTSRLTSKGIESYSPDYYLSSLGDLLDTMIEVLELDAITYRWNTERKLDIIVKKLSSERTLIIIDNFESVVDRQVLDFLGKIPGLSKSLLTSRQGGFSGSNPSIPQTLKGQLEIKVAELSEKDAIDLLIDKASIEGINLTRESREKLKKVVNQAARIPLALEWITGRMALKGGTLEDALFALRDLHGDPLSYCFNDLIQAVGGKAERILLAVPIFTTSVSVDMLSEVTLEKKESRDDSLNRLVSASLIELDLDSRYSVLEPTRLLVSVLWQKYPDLHQDYVFRAARAYITRLDYARVSRHWREEEVEKDNILSLFNWLYENNYFKLLIELADPLSDFLNHLGLWDQRVNICNLATLAAVNSGRISEAIQFTYDVAEISKHRGKLEQSFADFERCANFSRSINDSENEGRAIMQMGIVKMHQGKNIEAETLLQSSFRIFESVDDQKDLAVNLTVLGRNQIALGDKEKAEMLFKDSMQIKSNLQDVLGIAISLYDLGYLDFLRNDFLKAEENLNYSLKILSDTPTLYKRHRANAERYLAMLRKAQGDLKEAKKLYMEVLSIEVSLQRELNIDEIERELREINRLIIDQSRRSDDASEVTVIRKLAIICVENYKHLGRIPGLVNDAKEMIRLFSDPSLASKFDITEMHNEVTSESVRKMLTAFADQECCKDSPILIFLCHSIQMQDRTYICFYDTDLTNLEKTAIEGLEFAHLIRDMKASNLILLMDCAHPLNSSAIKFEDGASESITVGLGDDYLNYLASSSITRIITSTSAGEISHKLPPLKNRLFTHYLSKGFESSAVLRGDRKVHFWDLFYFLQQKINEKVNDQNPRIFPSSPVVDFTICSYSKTPYLSDAETYQKMSKALPQTHIMSLEDGMSKLNDISTIKEAINNDIYIGSDQLSAYLATANKNMQERVDQIRNEMRRIKNAREKYGQIDPKLEAKEKQLEYLLLDICQSIELFYKDLYMKTSQNETSDSLPSRTDFREDKRSVLQNRQKKLTEEYVALNNQYNNTTSDRERIQLSRQIDDLENKIRLIEAELQKLL